MRKGRKEVRHTPPAEGNISALIIEKKNTTGYSENDIRNINYYY